MLLLQLLRLAAAAPAAAAYADLDAGAELKSCCKLGPVVLPSRMPSLGASNYDSNYDSNYVSPVAVMQWMSGKVWVQKGQKEQCTRAKKFKTASIGR